MALFRPGFDLEAGDRVAEPLHGTGIVQPFGPPLLTFRHRAQGSQRFILGKYAKHELVSSAISVIIAEHFLRPPQATLQIGALYCRRYHLTLPSWIGSLFVFDILVASPVCAG